MIKITGISTAYLPEVTKTCLTMQSFNHKFDFYTHCILDQAIFSLTINSSRLKIHLDEYKIVVTDIIDNIKITLQRDSFQQVIID